MALEVANLFSITGKNVLVTGGGKGIGEMIAEGLIANGASVLICSRERAACERTAERLNGLRRGKCFAFGADLSKLDGLESLATKTREVFDGKLHALVNNSGKGWDQPIDKYDIVRGFEEILRLNLTAPFHLTKLCLPMLEAAQTPGQPATIINIASIAGMVTPPGSIYSYSTSKTGLIALSCHLAKDLGSRNITVNAIAPGRFFTRMLASTDRETFRNYTDPNHPAVIKFKKHISRGIPFGRLGDAPDIIGATIFLMSQAGSYVNGATLNVDGGLWLGVPLAKL